MKHFYAILLTFVLINILIDFIQTKVSSKEKQLSIHCSIVSQSINCSTFFKYETEYIDLAF